MKPRKVKGLDPATPLADNAERILRVRLDELCAFVPRALDPRQVDALHDMRIAAKRLRYALEVTAPCFGAEARRATKSTKELQDLLGEIHDCDVMLPIVGGHVADLRARDAEAVARLAGDAADLDPVVTARAPARNAYRGLEMLSVHLQARRTLLFERFVAFWADLERREFRGRLEASLSERSGVAG